MLGLNSDNHQKFLKEWFGKNWVYVLRPLIEAVKLVEFCDETAAKAANRAVWVVAVRERERRCRRRRGYAAVVARPIKPPVSWLERTLKED